MLPVGLSTRSLTNGDLDALVALAHAYDARWFGEPMLTLEDVRGAWSDPEFLPARDSEGWVDEDGALQAFATLDPGGTIELAVADAWEGAGLDEALTARWEAEAARRGYASVQRSVAEDDATGSRALTVRGYELDHTTWILTLGPDAPITEGSLPAGYAVRPATEVDATAVHRVIEDAFGEWRGWTRPFDSWRALNWDRPDLDPSHCRVVTFGGEVVGVCTALEPAADASRREVWVPQLAVGRPHRGRGLARLLLAETSKAARTRGVPHLGLATDTRTGALDLYRRLGMTVRHTLRCYALDLHAAPAADSPRATRSR